MMTTHVLRQFLLFCCMGVITFMVDALLFYGAWNLLGLPAGWARVVVLPLMLSVSWLLNRCFTFKPQGLPLWREWARFCVVNSGGALINAAVFLCLLALWPHGYVSVMFVAGVLAGLVFNFLGSRLWVFGAKNTG